MKVMKSEEAEKLVCPFMSQLQEIYVPLANGFFTDIKHRTTATLHQKCVTTKCMAWNTGKSTNNNPTLGYCERMNGDAR